MVGQREGNVYHIAVINEVYIYKDQRAGNGQSLEISVAFGSGDMGVGVLVNKRVELEMQRQLLHEVNGSIKSGGVIKQALETLLYVGVEQRVHLPCCLRDSKQCDSSFGLLETSLMQAEMFSILFYLASHSTSQTSGTLWP